MVNFKLSNELSLQQELYRKFAETELKPIAAEADETETFPMDVWKKVAKYGMLGIPFPAEYEGSGSNNLSYSICVEELSKQDASIGVSVSVHTSLCSTPIFMFGNEDQKKKPEVPPTVENVTCNDNKQILPPTPTKHEPIEKEDYRQENQKLERIE